MASNSQSDNVSINDQVKTNSEHQPAILSDTDILRQIEKQNIVIFPFTPSSLSNSSYDITLGKNFFRSHPEKFQVISNSTASQFNPRSGVESQSASQFNPRSGVYNPWNRDHVSKYWGTVQLADVVTQETEKDIGFPVGTRFIRLLPNEMILAHTQEFIGGKNFITTMMKCRSSVGRNAVSICRCAGYGDIGYTNRWTMEIANPTTVPIILPVGMRIGQIVFFYTGVPSSPYAGKYQESNDLATLIESWKPEMMLPQLYKDRDLGHPVIFDTPADRRLDVITYPPGSSNYHSPPHQNPNSVQSPSSNPT